MYQKTLSRGKFLAKYYLVNFNLIVSKVNFFTWWGRVAMGAYSRLGTY